MSRRVTIFGASFASGPSYQPETIAFLNAVGIADDGSTTIYGITGNAVWQGVDAYMVGIKADGVDLSKLYAYAYIGGDAVSHCREMLRPTDAALFSTFTASPLQDENGVTFQTTAQNALKPFGSAGFLPEFANVIGFYRRANATFGVNRIDLASVDGILTSVHSLSAGTGNTGLVASRSYSNAGPQAVVGNSLANLCATIRSVNDREIVRNESSLVTSAVAIVGTQPSSLFNLGNGNGIATLGNYSFEWFYQDAMTGPQMIAMQSRIHALQTVLNRAITY